MYEVADVKVWANLGLHLAEKIRGAVALQTYRLRGGEANKREAIAHLQRAVEYWDTVIEITRPIYRDMPLTHYNRNSRDANDDNLFHWARIRGQVAQDVEIARQAAFTPARQSRGTPGAAVRTDPSAHTRSKSL